MATSPTDGPPPAQARGRATKATWIGLCAILVVALLLRLIGIGSMLPLVRENDADIFDQAQALAGESRASLAPVSPEAIASKYPHLLAWLLMPWVSARPPAPADSAGSVLATDLRQAARPLEQARILMALLCVAAIPLTWLLGRRLLGAGPALLAAGFVACSLLHITLSQQVRPHGPFATFTLLAVLAALRLRRRASLGNLLLAGACFAAAAGCLQFGLLLLPALGVAILLMRPLGPRQWLGAALALVLVAAAIPVFYPFASFAGGVSSLVGAHNAGSYPWEPQRVARFYGLFLRYDPVLGTLAVAGLLAGLAGAVRRRSLGRIDGRDLAILLSAALPFLVIVGGVIHLQSRFFTALVPLAALPAAWLTWRVLTGLTERMRAPSARRVVAGCFVATVFLVPTTCAIKLLLLHTRPDTLTLAADWIRQHADREHDRILVQGQVSLPLYVWQQAIDPREMRFGWQPWDLYQFDHLARIPPAERWSICRLPRVHPLAENRIPGWKVRRTQQILETGARFLVVTDTTFDRDSPLLPPAARQWRLVARIDAVSDDRGISIYRGDSEPDMFLRVMRGLAWGPPVHIYEVGS
jgi:4-amino-4-deoxy-L-arabinose transferase-like glycosyltransferase